MNTFNASYFMVDLIHELKNQILNYDCKDFEKLEILIDEYIENECIYYSDCFKICESLHAYDFTAYDVDCKNISELAFYALRNLVINELDYNALEDLILETHNNID